MNINLDYGGAMKKRLGSTGLHHEAKSLHLKANKRLVG